MAWVYLDDQFPDHPKVVQAGGDAAWLFVCILCYCRRHGTGGEISVEQVRRLSTSERPSRLLNRLIDVGLIDSPWEKPRRNSGETAAKLPRYTVLYVHDWGEWNRAGISRSEAGRKAAEARWHKGSERSGGTPRSMPAHSERNANASLTHMPQDALSLPIPTTTTTTPYPLDDSDPVDNPGGHAPQTPVTVDLDEVF